jgi:hypothetical protein
MDVVAAAVPSGAVTPMQSKMHGSGVRIVLLSVELALNCYSH